MRDTEMYKLGEEAFENSNIQAVRVSLFDDIVTAIRDLRERRKNGWTFADACLYLNDCAGKHLDMSYFEGRFYDPSDPPQDVAQDLCEANAVPTDFRVGEKLDDTLLRGALRECLLKALGSMVSGLRGGELNPQTMLRFAANALQISNDEALESLQLLCFDDGVEAQEVAQMTWEENIDGDYMYEMMAIDGFAQIYLGTDSDDQVPDVEAPLQNEPFQCIQDFLNAMARKIEQCRLGELSRENLEKSLRENYDNKPESLKSFDAPMLASDVSPMDMASNFWNEVGNADDKEAVLQIWNRNSIQLYMQKERHFLLKRALDTKATMAREYKDAKETPHLKHQRRLKAPMMVKKLVSKHPHMRPMLNIARRVARDQISVVEARRQLEELDGTGNFKTLWKNMYENELDPVYFYEREIAEATGIHISSRYPISRHVQTDHPTYSNDQGSYSDSESDQSDDSDGQTEGLWGLRMPIGEAKKLASQLKLNDVHVDYHNSILKRKRKEQQVKRLILGDAPPDASNGLRHASPKRQTSHQISPTAPKRIKLTFRRAEEREANRSRIEPTLDPPGKNWDNLDDPVSTNWPFSPAEPNMATLNDSVGTEKSTDPWSGVNVGMNGSGCSDEGQKRVITATSSDDLNGQPNSNDICSADSTSRNDQLRRELCYHAYGPGSACTEDNQPFLVPPPSLRPTHRQLPSTEVNQHSLVPPPSPRPAHLQLPKTRVDLRPTAESRSHGSMPPPPLPRQSEMALHLTQPVPVTVSQEVPELMSDCLEGSFVATEASPVPSDAPESDGTNEANTKHPS